MSSVKIMVCKKCVTTYLVKWLTDWVREYGVDGFRCDTAKHINVTEWGKLKKGWCTSSLKNGDKIIQINQELSGQMISG